jgi:excisionase family DNA binding protein
MKLDTAAARDLGRVADDIGRAAREDGEYKVSLAVEGLTESTLMLPAALVGLFRDLFDDLSEGRDVAVAPADLLVGTEKAAEVLGVSRVWVAELLDRGELPVVMAGSHRRVALGDLMAFRRADDRRRRGEAVWSFLDENPV